MKTKKLGLSFDPFAHMWTCRGVVERDVCWVLGGPGQGCADVCGGSSLVDARAFRELASSTLVVTSLAAHYGLPAVRRTHAFDVPCEPEEGRPSYGTAAFLFFPDVNTWDCFPGESVYAVAPLFQAGCSCRAPPPEPLPPPPPGPQSPRPPPPPPSPPAPPPPPSPPPAWWMPDPAVCLPLGCVATLGVLLGALLCIGLLCFMAALYCSREHVQEEMAFSPSASDLAKWAVDHASPGGTLRPYRRSPYQRRPGSWWQRCCDWLSDCCWPAFSCRCCRPRRVQPRIGFARTPDGAYVSTPHRSAARYSGRFSQWSGDADMRAAFARADRNLSGKLDYNELKEALHELGLDIDDRESVRVLQRYDANRNGLLELSEFARLAAELKSLQARGARGDQWSDTEVRAGFRRYDANNSGKLDYKELRVALRGLGVNADNTEATRILQAYDEDGNGLMDLSEFTRLVHQVQEAGAALSAAAAPETWLESGTPCLPSAALLPKPSNSVLPAGWVEAYDEASSQTYYFNQETRVTQWTRPDTSSPRSGSSFYKPTPRSAGRTAPTAPPRTSQRSLFGSVRSSSKSSSKRDKGGSSSFFSSGSRSSEPAPTYDDDDPRHISKIIEVFNRYDANNSGQMDYRELKNALAYLGLSVDTSEAKSLLNDYDTDRNGVLTLDEFRVLVRKLPILQA